MYPHVFLSILEETEENLLARPQWRFMNHMVVLEALTECISTAKNLTKQSCRDGSPLSRRVECAIPSIVDLTNAYLHGQDPEKDTYIGFWALTAYMQGQCPTKSKKAARKRYKALSNA